MVEEAIRLTFARLAFGTSELPKTATIYHECRVTGVAAAVTAAAAAAQQQLQKHTTT